MQQITKYSFLLILLIVAPSEGATSALSVRGLNVTKMSGEIVVDGLLDDTGWIGAAEASDFLEIHPGENIPAIVQTEAFVTYDDGYLYVGFMAYDDPKNIRANISNRDKMFRDDFCGILLDTYGDANRAYELMVNPLGIQGDGQKIGDNEDESFDMIFSAAGMITDQGYQIEIALPFSSIRFPDQHEQDWRLNFFRVLPRDDSRRQLSWSPYDRNNPCMLCQLGYLNGISGIHSRRSVEFLPGLVGRQSGVLDSNNVFQNEAFESDLALGIKIPLWSAATAEVAINPDFSQVEADVTQFDVNTAFALSYPERRPFFNEGSDLFNAGGHDWQPNIKPIYTRSINDPSLAIKILGRMGNTDYGMISARDEETGIIVPFEEWSELVPVGKSYVNVLRLKHAMKNSSYIGGVLTDKRYVGGSGTNVGTDGKVYINQNWSINWQAFTSLTTEPNDTVLSAPINGENFNSNKLTSAFDGESYSGHQLFTRLSRNTRNSFIDFFYAEKSPAFRLDTGFLQQNHQRNLGANFTLVRYPKTGILENYFLTFASGRVWNYDWQVKERWFYSSLDLQFKGRLNAGLTLLPTSESFSDSIFTGLRMMMVNINKSFSEKITVGLNASDRIAIIRYLSPPEKGHAQTISSWVNYNPYDNLSFNATLELDKASQLHNSAYYYNGQYVRLHVTYQFNHHLSLRLITQYFYQQDYVNEEVVKSFDVLPLLSYQPNPFTIFYIGSAHNIDESIGGYKTFNIMQNSRNIFLKLQYLFQT